MKAFLQNEIRLFFSRKNYLVWIVGVLAVVFAYRLYYVTQYENYAQTVLEELEENAKDIAAWLQGQESLEDCLKACDGRVDSSSAN